jgi:hypothetical protein
MRDVVPELTRIADIKLNNRLLLRCQGDALGLRTGQFPQTSGPTVAKPSGDHTPLGGFVLRPSQPCQPGRERTGSTRCEICLTVVIVAKMRAVQNAPINAENIKRESMAHSKYNHRKPNYGDRLPQSQSTFFGRERLTQPARESGMSFSWGIGSCVLHLHLQR